jgi:hypothetical protein
MNQNNLERNCDLILILLNFLYVTNKNEPIFFLLKHIDLIKIKLGIVKHGFFIEFGQFAAMNFKQLHKVFERFN